MSYVHSGDHSYYFVHVGDLNDDGKYDYLLSRGAVQQEAFSADGRRLWIYSDPSASFADLDPESDVRIYDLDGDGQTEVLLGRMVRGELCLCVLEGKSGRIKRQIPYPGFAQRRTSRSGLAIAKLADGDRASHVVVTWDLSYVAALDAELRLVWTGPMNLGQRTPKVFDVDHDGKEEVLCSATLLDDDGGVIWNRQSLPQVRSPITGRFVSSNVDSPHIAEIDGNPSNGPEIFISQGAWLLSSSGRTLWGLGREVVFGHHAGVGRCWTGSRGVGIVLVDWQDRGITGGSRRVLLLDSTGRTIWEKQAEWAVLGDWTGDGICEVFLGTGDIVDARGSTVGRVREFFSNAVVGDVTGDSCEELITVTTDESSRQAWLEVYSSRSQEGEPCRATPDASRRLTNWTCY